MNGNARPMSNCTRSLIFLAAIAAGTLGCTANNYPSPQPAQGLRTGILLFPSAHSDADDIGSLAPDAAAPPSNLGDYRRPSAHASLKAVSVSRHPFR